MLARWETHVMGWLAAADAFDNVHAVSYERLRDDYAATMAGVCADLDCAGGPYPEPARDAYIIAPDAQRLTTGDVERAELRQWVAANVQPATRAHPALAPLFAE